MPHSCWQYSVIYSFLAYIYGPLAITPRPTHYICDVSRSEAMQPLWVGNVFNKQASWCPLLTWNDCIDKDADTWRTHEGEHPVAKKKIKASNPECSSIARLTACLDKPTVTGRANLLRMPVVRLGTPCKPGLRHAGNWYVKNKWGQQGCTCWRVNRVRVLVQIKMKRACLQGEIGHP
jgi:hypothetical protein